MTYTTPDQSLIDRIVVPNNWVNIQEKACMSNPRQDEVSTDIPKQSSYSLDG